MATVLLIDDDEMVRAVIRAQLENAKLDVTEAGDGDEGLQQYRQRPFDLVITDIIMPNKEGIDTILEIRSINPNAKIVAMSGGGRRNNFEFLEYARKLGAAASLQKPFTRQKLLDTVTQCLEA